MVLARSSPIGTIYFRCAKHAKKSLTGEVCHANYVPEDDIIEAVELALCRVREMNQAEIVEMLSSTGNSERDELEAQRVRVEQAIAKDRAALARLVQFVSAGALDIDACAAENERIANRH